MPRWGGEEQAGRPGGLGQGRYFGAGVSPVTAGQWSSAAIVLGVENPLLTPSPRAENSPGWSPQGLGLGPMSDSPGLAHCSGWNRAETEHLAKLEPRQRQAQEAPTRGRMAGPYRTPLQMQKLRPREEKEFTKSCSAIGQRRMRVWLLWLLSLHPLPTTSTYHLGRQADFSPCSPTTPGQTLSFTPQEKEHQTLDWLHPQHCVLPTVTLPLWSLDVGETHCKGDPLPPG